MPRCDADGCGARGRSGPGGAVTRVRAEDGREGGGCLYPRAGPGGPPVHVPPLSEALSPFPATRRSGAGQWPLQTLPAPRSSGGVSPPGKPEGTTARRSPALAHPGVFGVACVLGTLLPEPVASRLSAAPRCQTASFPQAQQLAAVSPSLCGSCGPPGEVAGTVAAVADAVAGRGEAAAVLGGCRQRAEPARASRRRPRRLSRSRRRERHRKAGPAPDRTGGRWPAAASRTSPGKGLAACPPVRGGLR